MNGYSNRLALVVALCAAASIPLPALGRPVPSLAALAAVSDRYVSAVRASLWQEVPAARWLTTGLPMAQTRTPPEWSSS